ncbi:MAG TPA: TIGR03086 family metal-binding protein [Actinophytocola sp.]|uniref:TIGR03086 family metal-binding protein n=1 Tax=Actinophytocola sp. TaxID=1872138 RepID=UPI002DDD9FF9|nr:TIGR03086 family metal-binding protein [Actinophytocola sp.]HEV2778337.1 TIGR03086 family metal-binding protein [Actinophytocola sp.]
MEVLEAHGRAMDVFDRAVRKIEAGSWDAPTPCSEWTVRDLLNHLVYEQLWVPDLLGGATVAEIGDRYEGDQLGDDPVRSWTEASRAARRAWLAPGALDRSVRLSRGATPAAEYCQEMTIDLAVHGWDLATALGAETEMGDELAGFLLRSVEPHVDNWQGIGIFAAPVPVPADADAQTRLVALLGRDPDWTPG